MENTPKKKIVLTGGGTAGHVSPNIALLPYLQEAGYEVTYIGSKKGIEKNLIADFGLPYVGISTGKLRRYFDVKNFTDPFDLGDHVLGALADNKLADSLKVAVAAAGEVEILDDVILIQREVDHCGTSSFGSVLHSILLMICLLWGSEFR